MAVALASPKTASLHLPIRFSLYSPPYLTCMRVPHEDCVRSAGLPNGTVLFAELSNEASDCASLPAVIKSIRQRLPIVPVVLVLDRASPHLIRICLSVQALGIRGVVLQNEDLRDLRDSLRPVLTQPLHLGDDVVEWISWRGIRLSPAVTHVLCSMFDNCHAFPTLGGLLEGMGEAERTTRLRFKKKGLPTPHRWFQLARATRGALQIQGDPHQGFGRLAQAVGFSDPSSLSQQIYRAFNLRPHVIRGTFGWEWLLERWLRSIPEMSDSIRD